MANGDDTVESGVCWAGGEVNVEGSDDNGKVVGTAVGEEIGGALQPTSRDRQVNITITCRLAINVCL